MQNNTDLCLGLLLGGLGGSRSGLLNLGLLGGDGSGLSSGCLDGLSLLDNGGSGNGLSRGRHYEKLVKS